MSNAVESRYEIKARQLQLEQRESEIRVRGANDAFRAASERVSVRETSYAEAKRKLSRAKSSDPVLELEVTKSQQRLLKQAKECLDASVAEFTNTSEIRTGLLTELGQIRSKSEFINAKLEAAEVRSIAKIDEAQNEALIEAVTSRPEAIESLSADNTVDIPEAEALDLDSNPILQAAAVTEIRPEVIPAVETQPHSRQDYQGLAGDSPDSGSSDTRSHQAPPDLEVWQDKGVVTAKFDVGADYKVELTAEGTGPVAVYIAATNGRELSSSTVQRIKDQLKAKQIEYSSLVVAKGNR